MSMIHHRQIVWMAAAMLVLGWLWPAGSVQPLPGIDRAHAQGQSQPRMRGTQEDPGYRSAVSLLRQCLHATRDGRHKMLIEALRHLKDPQLKPLFEELAQQRHPQLKIQGVLGLAELQPEPRVDLKRIAELDDEPLQVAIISAAMDSDLLRLEDLKTMLTWNDLDDGVKIVIASYLLEKNAFEDRVLLMAAMESPLVLRRGLAALMLTQMGDPAGMAYLRELNESDSPLRDEIRTRLLEIVARQGYDRAATWAFEVAQEPNIPLRLSLTALRVAMRHGEPRAIALWRERVGSSTEASHRTLLAMTALELSPWLPAAEFDLLIASDHPLIQQMGRAGKAVAADSPDLVEQLIDLVDLEYHVANTWILLYAREKAETTNAQLVLLHMILSHDKGDERGRDRRLDNAISAAQLLYERDPQTAVGLLRPILADANSDQMLLQGILLGLVRASQPNAYQVVQGLPAFGDTDADALRLLLLARQLERPMDDAQLDRMQLLARGGSRLLDSLRIQVAWLYVKRIDHAQQALNDALRF